MKPGYRTTEFWLSILSVVIGCVAASGFLAQGPILQGLGLAQSMLTTLGYGWMRTSGKNWFEAVKPDEPQVKSLESESIRTGVK